MTSNFIVQLKACQHASVYKQKLFKYTKGYTYSTSVLNSFRYYRAFNKWVLSQGKFNQDMHKPGACNRSPGSKLLSITTQLHCGGHLGERA